MEAVSFPNGRRKPNLAIDDALPSEASKRSVQEPTEIFGRFEKIQQCAEMGQKLSETSMSIQREQVMPLPIQPVPAGQGHGVRWGEAPFEVEVKLDLRMAGEPQ
jgi:hypothetical protein